MPNCNEMSVGERMALLSYAFDELLRAVPKEDWGNKVVEIYQETAWPRDEATYGSLQAALPNVVAFWDLGSEGRVTPPAALLSMLFLLSTTHQDQPPSMAFEGIIPTADTTLFARGFGLDAGVAPFERAQIQDRSFDLLSAFANGMGQPGDIVLVSPAPEGWPLGEAPMVNPFGLIVDRDNQGVTVRFGFGLGGFSWDERYQLDGNSTLKTARLIPMQYDVGPYLGPLPQGQLPPYLAQLVESCRNPDSSASEKPDSSASTSSGFPWGKALLAAAAVAGGAWGLSKVMK